MDSKVQSATQDRMEKGAFRLALIRALNRASRTGGHAIDRVAMQLINQALAGNLRAVSEIANRLDGAVFSDRSVPAITNNVANLTIQWREPQQERQGPLIEGAAIVEGALLELEPSKAQGAE